MPLKLRIVGASIVAALIALTANGLALQMKNLFTNGGLQQRDADSPGKVILGEWCKAFDIETTATVDGTRHNLSEEEIQSALANKLRKFFLPPSPKETVPKTDRDKPGNGKEELKDVLKILYVFLYQSQLPSGDLTKNGDFREKLKSYFGKGKVDYLYQLNADEEPVDPLVKLTGNGSADAIVKFRKAVDAGRHARSLSREAKDVLGDGALRGKFVEVGENLSPMPARDSNDPNKMPLILGKDDLTAAKSINDWLGILPKDYLEDDATDDPFSRLGRIALKDSLKEARDEPEKNNPIVHEAAQAIHDFAKALSGLFRVLPDLR